MDITNPQIFDHIKEINGEIIQPKLVTHAQFEPDKVQADAVVWRDQAADEYHIPPAILAVSGEVVAVKRFTITGWNMDVTASKVIPHGLEWGRIDHVTAYIINDNGVDRYGFEGNGSTIGTGLFGFIHWSATNITLYRAPGGMFDNANYDHATMTRGKVTVWHWIN